MSNTIIIEIETVDTCCGIMARFWYQNKPIEQVMVKQVINTMNEITARYNNEENTAVLFSTR